MKTNLTITMAIGLIGGLITYFLLFSISDGKIDMANFKAIIGISAIASALVGYFILKALKAKAVRKTRSRR